MFGQKKMTEAQYLEYAEEVGTREDNFADEDPKKVGTNALKRQLVFAREQQIRTVGQLEGVMDDIIGKRKWLKAMREREHNLLEQLEKLEADE